MHNINGGIIKPIKSICLLMLVILGSSFLNTCCYAEEKKTVKFLAISGSIRKESCNKKALKVLVRAVRDAGAEVTHLDLADYPMPLYDGDLESQQGLPANVKKFQSLIAKHDGLIIASPEYNGLPTPLLKNALDWASRTDKNNQNSGVKIFEGKVAALISASPSNLGGVRGLPITAQFLSNLGLIVVPDRATIGNCFENFDANGEVKDERIRALIIKEGKMATKIALAIKYMN